MKTHRFLVMRRPTERAFTLVELLVVIAIIAILAALSVGAFTFAQQKSSRDRTSAAMQAIVSGLEQYKEKFGEYPEVANPASSGDFSGAKLRYGGAATLYQALTGDGDDQIKMTSGNAAGRSSDGKVDDQERANTINATLPKSIINKSNYGYILVDGFGHPFQYEKGGPTNTNAVNPTYDLWSIGTQDANTGGNVNSAAEKKEPDKTAPWIKNW